MPIDTTRTGAAIAAHRLRMNLSQQGLAGLMNVTHQAVSKWEKGLALPDTETLLALAKLFAVSMEDLLMGILPEEEAFEPEVDEAPTEEAETACAEWTQMDFSSIINMLPFVSIKVADQLFRTYYRSAQPDAQQLVAIAPFISKQTLRECISAQPLTECSPEMLCALAPFLPPNMVDELLLGMDEKLPPHIAQTLIPFASPKAVDEMVLSKLGMKAEAASTTGANIPLLQNAQRKIDAIQQKNNALHEKLESRRQQQNAERRERPRVRLLHRAIEQGNMELILAQENLAEMVSFLPSDEQKLVCTLLMENGMYNTLAEVMEEQDDDVLNDLLDKAFEMDDPELLRLISQHI